MRFILDSADVNEVKEALNYGVIEVVATNPTFIARQKKSVRRVVEEISQVFGGPIAVEAVSLKVNDIVKEARELSKMAPNIIVKIPLNREGLKTIAPLVSEGVKTNATLIFSPNQALLAARAGSTFISPFVGRMDDIGHDGIGLIRTIREIYDKYEIKTQLIAASVRHPYHVLNAALVGADFVAVPFRVLEMLPEHPMTEKGLKTFISNFKKIPSE